MPDLSAILAERGATHGDFTDHAEITQTLKAVARSRDSFNHLSFIQQEAIDMILHKIGRVLSGNPDHVDHWTDIAGYATLVADRLAPA